MSGFSEILRGINGNLELSRVNGFVAGMVYSLGAVTFTAWNMAEGREFDVVAFCTAFGAGAAFITGGTAAAVSWKDKGVASAKVIEATGSKPATPPNPAPLPQPALAEAATAPVGDADIPEYAR